MSRKSDRLEQVSQEIEALNASFDADPANVTPENETKFKALLAEGEKLQIALKDEAKILGFKASLSEPANQRKAVEAPENEAGKKAVEPNSEGGKAEQFSGKSIGTTFVENEGYKRAVKSGMPHGTRVVFDMKDIKKPSEMKATFDTPTTGLTGGVIYQPGIVTLGQQRLTIDQLFAQGETSTNVVHYIREVSFTNSAGMVAEGGEKPEASFVTAPVDAPVKKIAVLAKVTDEMFADFPMMRDYINQRLVFMVEQKEEQQLVNGTGSGSQLLGVLNVSGIQTQAKGGLTTPDAFLNAITKVRAVGFFEPDAAVVHPTDWQNLKELKDNNGQYYFGGPFMNNTYGNMLPSGESIWNLKVVVTTAIPQGTALVGAFKMGGQVFRRQGITVDATNTNEDDFSFNLMSIRVEERLALAIYRPLAFATVTGL